MGKHTPGEWRANSIGEVTSEHGKTADASWFRKLYVDPSKDRIPDDEMMANAYLIAAAPEMLEALEDVLAVLNHPEKDLVFDVIAIREAIAKARGES